MNDADIQVQQWINEAVEGPNLIEVDGLALLSRDSAGRDGLRAQKISTLDDVMQLRVLRNECREQMTYMRDEISEANQLIWWQNVSGSDQWKIWLLYRRDLPAAIGFFLLRHGTMAEGPFARWYLTLGLTASERRKGYGTWVYAAARCLSDGLPVHALILKSNEGSIKAATRAGYKQEPYLMSEHAVIKMVGSPQ